MPVCFKFARWLTIVMCGIVTSGIAGIGLGQSYGPAVIRGQPIILFDGLTLDGWTKANGQPAEGWVVENGALYRYQRGGDLFYGREFRDFELHFQWKISPGGNSGVKYRVKKYGQQWLGCEYQLLDDWSAREANKSGALYALYPPHENKRAAAPEIWHQAKIVVCGNRIEHWLNGQLIVQACAGSTDWKSRVARSKFRDRELFGENRQGRIFLQDHGNPVWFRHIVLFPLYCDQSTSYASLGFGDHGRQPFPAANGDPCHGMGGMAHPTPIYWTAWRSGTPLPRRRWMRHRCR